MGRMEMALLWRQASMAPGGHFILALSQQFHVVSAASEGREGYLLPPPPTCFMDGEVKIQVTPKSGKLQARLWLLPLPLLIQHWPS